MIKLQQIHMDMGKYGKSEMLMITKIVNLITKSNDKKDLKVVKICVLNRSMRLHHTVTLMGDAK